MTEKKLKGSDVEDIGHVILFLAALTGIWQLIFSLGIFPRVSLPSPAMVAQSFVMLFANATLITSISMTMWRLVISFSTSIILGVGVGLLMVRFRHFGKTIELVCGRITIISQYSMGTVCNFINRIK